MKEYWETIAERLKSRGWSLGYCAAISPSGELFYILDAQCGDDKRYIFHSDEMLTAFLELERIAREM